MNLKIQIDESRISELVEEELVKRILDDKTHENRNARYGVREGVDKAIKAYIYNNKDQIIERVVERATTEIVKKGLPKLLDNLAREVKK